MIKSTNQHVRIMPGAPLIFKYTALKLPDIEAVAAKVHEAWMQAKLSQGIRSRKSESGEELMVEYAQLSESAKELDRGSVRAVYSAIESLAKEQSN